MEGENYEIEINTTIDTNSTATKTYFSLYDYLIPSFGLIIIVTNFCVVVSSGLILKKGRQPRSTYLFLGNVGMTDLVTGVAVVLGQLYPKDKRDHYVCALQIGMIVSSTLTSIYSVGLIAIDRFLYIVYGLKYSTWVYPTRARILIAIIWIIGLIVGFVPLMGWYGDTNNGKICWFILLAPKGLVLLTVVVGVVPLLVVLVLYSVILHHAIKKIRQIQNSEIARHPEVSSCSNITPTDNTNNLRIFRGHEIHSESEPEETTEKSNGLLGCFKKKPSSSVKLPSKWKAIKVVMFTTGSFIITWAPYFSACIVYVLNCDEENPEKMCKTLRILIASPLAILGFMNSLINPLIYVWWHKGFREFIKSKMNATRRRRTSVSLLNSSRAHGTHKESNATSTSSDCIVQNL